MYAKPSNLGSGIVLQSLRDTIVQQLVEHEGFKRFPYKCTAGALTIGYGRNLDAVGISRYEAVQLLFADVIEAIADCQKIFPLWDTFAIGRQVALADMRFNLGPAGFRNFRKMIQAIFQNDWKLASQEAINSKWYRQVGQRAFTIVRQIETGYICSWPDLPIADSDPVKSLAAIPGKTRGLNGT